MTTPETYTTVDIVAGVTVDIGRAPTPKGMQAGPPPLMVRIHGPDYPDGWFEAESDWSSVQLATVLSNRYIPSDVACACYEAGWRAEKARADDLAAKLAEVSRPCGRARPLPEGVRGLFTPPFKVDPSDPERLVDSLGNIAAGRMFYNAHFDAWGRERFRHLPYGNELYDAWCEWFDMDAEDGAEVARRLNEAWRVTP